MAIGCCPMEAEGHTAYSETGCKGERTKKAKRYTCPRRNKTVRGHVTQSRNRHAPTRLKRTRQPRSHRGRSLQRMMMSRGRRLSRPPERFGSAVRRPAPVVPVAG